MLVLSVAKSVEAGSFGVRAALNRLARPAEGSPRKERSHKRTGGARGRRRSDKRSQTDCLLPLLEERASLLAVAQADRTADQTARLDQIEAEIVDPRNAARFARVDPLERGSDRHGWTIKRLIVPGLLPKARRGTRKGAPLFDVDNLEYSDPTFPQGRKRESGRALRPILPSIYPSGLSAEGRAAIAALQSRLCGFASAPAPEPLSPAPIPVGSCEHATVVIEGTLYVAYNPFPVGSKPEGLNVSKKPIPRDWRFSAARWTVGAVAECADKVLLRKIEDGILPAEVAVRASERVHGK